MSVVWCMLLATTAVVTTGFAPHARSVIPVGRTSTNRIQSPRFYRNDGNVTDVAVAAAGHRFERTASVVQHVEQPCILTIDGVQYNVTAWARAHPGGEAILQKFHGKDATTAFHKAHHSAAAVAMLQDFAIVDAQDDTRNDNAPVRIAPPSTELVPSTKAKSVQRWRFKLFTKEDPIGVHKYLGVFVLLHFAFRFFQMFFTDPSAGLGTRLGRGPSWIALACLVPHGLLSASSLIFHTVPKHRVVGKPMIWQEFRAHNIAFGLRSVVATALCAVAIRGGNTPVVRAWCVGASGVACLASMVAADVGTHLLRSNEQESTTATMPYWDGCSVATQKRFKSFYAYSQFLATLACLMVTNPAFPLSVLLAIQMASLLMTLVRKGLVSTRQYHLGYTAALVAPYLVGLRSMVLSPSLDVAGLFVLGGILYQLRRRGINKYVLWVPVILGRIAVGDRFASMHGW